MGSPKARTSMQQGSQKQKMGSCQVLRYPCDLSLGGPIFTLLSSVHIFCTCVCVFCFVLFFCFFIVCSPTSFDLPRPKLAIPPFSITWQFLVTPFGFSPLLPTQSPFPKSNSPQRRSRSGTNCGLLDSQQLDPPLGLVPTSDPVSCAYNGTWSHDIKHVCCRSHSIKHGWL